MAARSLIHPSLTLCFYLGVGANGASTLCTGVGTELVEALGAHVLLILLHVFLAVQVVAAVEAVGSISHGGGEIRPGTCGATSEGQNTAPRLHTPDGVSVALSNIPVRSHSAAMNKVFFRGARQENETKEEGQKLNILTNRIQMFGDLCSVAYYPKQIYARIVQSTACSKFFL